MQQRVFKEKNMFDFALYLKSYKIDTHKKETEKNFGNFLFLKRCWIYGHDSKKSNTDKSPSLFYKKKSRGANRRNYLKRLHAKVDR